MDVDCSVVCYSYFCLMVSNKFLIYYVFEHIISNRLTAFPGVYMIVSLLNFLLLYVCFACRRPCTFVQSLVNLFIFSLISFISSRVICTYAQRIHQNLYKKVQIRSTLA